MRPFAHKRERSSVICETPGDMPGAEVDVSSVVCETPTKTPVDVPDAEVDVGSVICGTPTKTPIDLSDAEVDVISFFDTYFVSREDFLSVLNGIDLPFVDNDTDLTTNNDGDTVDRDMLANGDDLSLSLIHI